jgi:hypothetical protein
LESNHRTEASPCTLLSSTGIADTAYSIHPGDSGRRAGSL